jgi:hypothetical protein
VFKTPFTLKPFAEAALSPALQKLQVGGSVERHQPVFNGTTDLLTLQFDLQGDLAGVQMAAAKLSPQREDNLWQETCFEFFLALSGSPQYWEFNLAPSGDWNIYRFSDYREGMARELAYKELPFTLTYPQPDQVGLRVSFDLAAIVPLGQPFDLGITMVILDQTPTHSYWALAHPGPEADFHRRDGFKITV